MAELIERHLSKILCIFSIVALVGAFISSGEPVIGYLKNTSLETHLTSVSYTNTIIFNLCIGFLTSFFFWLLVSFLPEKNKKRILKNNLLKSYSDFKAAIIRIVLAVCNDNQDYAELMTPENFRTHFKKDNQTKWYIFVNSIKENNQTTRELLFEMDLFASEISYFLNNSNVSDGKAHDLFKSLMTSITRLRSRELDYETQKMISQFLWAILSNWDWEKGYPNNDIIQNKMRSL